MTTSLFDATLQTSQLDKWRKPSVLRHFFHLWRWRSPIRLAFLSFSC
jgi:hypothetical protein